jgi:LysR family hydrogen peroxide-inducible transcriptional activator
MQFGTLPLTLRQLQYVVAVADLGSFRKAAEACHVSQPTLSAQVADLEAALNVQLFERGRRGVSATGAGHVLVARARSIIVSAGDLIVATQQSEDPLSGMLRLGVIPTVCPYLLPDLDPALRKEFPQLNLRWVEDKTEILVHKLERGELDAALLALEADLGDLDHEVIGQDPFVLAAPKAHALAKGRQAVNVSDLKKQDVLLLDDGHCFRDQALELCQKAGAEELSFRATSLTTLVQMAQSGSSVTLLPKIALDVENRNQQLRVRAFSQPVPDRTLVYAWRKGSPLEKAISQLAQASRAPLKSALSGRK